MLVDLHAHTAYSYDGDPDSHVEDTVQNAIAAGLGTLALTEHADFFYVRKKVMYDIASSQRDIAEAQQKYRGQIDLLQGIEVGEIHVDPAAQELLNTWTFDEVIGSIHSMPNDVDIYFWDFDRVDEDRFFKDYFAELYRMVCFGGFDVLAHIDYPLRVMKNAHNHPSFANYMEQLLPILQETIRRGYALEINAASLFGWMGHPGPEDFILREYRRLGGERISIGSDSHKAATVGRGARECAAYARAAGFDSVTVFHHRKPEQVALTEEDMPCSK